MLHADREVEDLGCRPPAWMAAVLLVNALVSAALGLAFVSVAAGAASADTGARALYLVCGLACLGFAGWLVWTWHCESRVRLIADRDGIALRTRGRSRHPWAQVDRFEVGKLFYEGVVRMEAVDGHCGVMVLRSRQRIVLRALRTHAPFGGPERDEIAARVATLNALRATWLARDGAATVLESGARC